MAFKQKFIDLINEEIDGDISAADQALLDGQLAENADLRQLREELRGVSSALNSLQPASPPVELTKLIMQKAAPSQPPEHASAGISEFVAGLFGIPVFRYALSFAAGAVLVATLFGSGQTARHAFDDVTNLVGTMSGTDLNDGMLTGATLNINHNELAGTVSLAISNSLMVLDFNLASEKPVEIVATFDDRDIWFNGFAQLESQGTTVAAATGRVTVRMEGQRRYAVYLQNASNDAATVYLRFIAAGETLHEGELSLGEQD